MKFTAIFFVAILICIVVVAVQLIAMQNDTEGFDPSIPWDYDYINNVHSANGFTLDGGVTVEYLRDYLINTLKLPYQSYIIPGNPNEDFPKLGDGVCMTDWYSVTDITNQLTNARTIRDEATGRANQDVVGGSAQDSYNRCKQLAINNGANVFGVQYGMECFYGNTNELALGKRTIKNGDSRPSSTPLSKEYCARPGYPAENGSGWTQTVYVRGRPKKVYRFNDYDKIIQEFVAKGVNTFSELQNSNDLNRNISPFTAIEGMEVSTAGGIPIAGKLVSADNIVKISSANGKAVEVNNKIIQLLIKNKYAVTVEEFDGFLNAMQGKWLEGYVIISSRFNILSEDTMTQFVDKVTRDLNPHPNSFNDKLTFIILLMCYGIRDVNAIINPFNDAAHSNWFSQAIESLGLNKLKMPMFPPTDFGSGRDMNYYTENVMMKLWSIGVMALDISQFFGIFTQRDTSVAEFFDKIYPVLKSPTFNYYYKPGDKGLRELNRIIQYVIPASNGNGLAAGFLNINELLTKLNFTFNEYVRFMNKLTNTVGPLTDAQDLIDKFTSYYMTVAYSDVSNNERVIKTSVTANMIFSEFIDVIDPITAPTRYFSPVSIFNHFLQICIDHKYTVANIQRDKLLGATYSQFMGAGGSTELINISAGKSGFQTLYGNTSGSEFDILYEIRRVLTVALNLAFQTSRRILGYKEGATTATNASTLPDNQVLINFGIKDFGKELGELEQVLLGNGYGFTTWIDMMIFIEPLSSIIQYSELNEYITTLTTFGANTKDEWATVSSYLSSIKIDSYDSIKHFLTIITAFGVKFTSFSDFNKTMSSFDANLSLSPPAINPSALRTFCEDLSRAGFTYDHKKMQINNIVSYFSKAGYNLQTYPRIPSLLINSLIEYDNSSPYKNKLHDITQDSPLTNLLPDNYDSSQLLYQVYLLAANKTDDIINDEKVVTIFSIDSTRVSQFVSFLYSEEYEVLKTDSGTAYANIDHRLTLMKDITDAIQKFASNYSSDSAGVKNPGLHEFFTKLSYMCTIFPAFMFEFLHRTVYNNCVNGQNCFDDAVNPNYTYSKATTTNLTTNYRPNPPIV